MTPRAGTGTGRRVVYSAARSLTVEPAGTTPPPSGQVRIDVAYTGICGTDPHIFHGDMDARVKPPGVLGHEMSGIGDPLAPLERRKT